MPRFNETVIRGFAHCRNSRCPGNAQQEVDAVRVETEYTFGDHGGDGVFTSMVESSVVEHRFADPEEAPCPACGEGREVTDKARPSYLPLSGKDPMGLLGMQPGQAPAQNNMVAELQELRAQVAALLEAQSKGK